MGICAWICVDGWVRGGLGAGGQVVEDAASGDEAEGGGHVGGGSEAAIAAHVDGGVVVADAGDAAVILVEILVFVGVDGLDMEGRWEGVAWDFWESIMDAQEAADVVEEWVFAGVCKVGMADAGCVTAACGAAAGDDELLAVVALGEEE